MTQALFYVGYGVAAGACLVHWLPTEWVFYIGAGLLFGGFLAAAISTGEA